MPRPERRLDPAAGPVQRLAAQLRQLRRDAGNPGYRELAERCGYSTTTLSDAAGGRRLPALAALLAYVRACGGDPGAWGDRWRTAVAELADAHRPGSPPPRPPYLGPATFQPGDARRFFGREELIDELVRRLAGGGFLAVIGASGVGKSSLLRAGLLPALTAAGVTDHVLATPRAFPGAVIAPVVLVDQFEELFTQVRGEAARVSFVHGLLDAVATRRATVVITVRSDFVRHCLRYPRLAGALLRGTVELGPLDVGQLTRAVRAPAADAGLQVEGALITAVVAEAGDRVGALPMISRALRETWRLRQGNQLTLAAYRAAGGVAGAVARATEQLHDGLDDIERAIARELIARLAAPGRDGIELLRLVDRRELEIAGAPTVLERMVAGRLVVVDGTSVELAHGALLDAWPGLRQWLTTDRAGWRIRRQLTEAAGIWHALGRDPGALYRGIRLARTREWVVDRRAAGAPVMLTREEYAFLVASTAAETVERTAAARRSGRGGRGGRSRTAPVRWLVSRPARGGCAHRGG